ncbi:MAG: ABC-type transport auxiliary lipoprotein family protein [Campylobacterota bacterium]|nr:ABC-type transport auxiliary lipoprotein family protein [Campylobacterota bacterium]
MKKSIIFLVSIFAGVVLFSGCSAKTEPIRTYTLSPVLDFGRASHSPYRSKTVIVAYPTNINGKASKSLNFSYHALEVGRYHYAKWSANNSQLILNSTIRALDKSSIFKSTVDYTTLAYADYLLESEVYEFYHRVREDSSDAVFTIKFNLIDMSNNWVVRSRKFSYRIPTPTKNAQGYVAATNKALTLMSRDLVRWLAQ